MHFSINLNFPFFTKFLKLVNLPQKLLSNMKFHFSLCFYCNKEGSETNWFNCHAYVSNISRQQQNSNIILPNMISLKLKKWKIQIKKFFIFWSLRAHHQEALLVPDFFDKHHITYNLWHKLAGPYSHNWTPILDFIKKYQKIAYFLSHRTSK